MRLLLAIALCLCPVTVSAEWYAAVQGGYSQPEKFTNFHTEYATAGSTNDALWLKSSVGVGLKGGYFFESHKWLGLEFDYIYTTPHLKQQWTTYRSPHCAPEGYVLDASNFHVHSMSANLVLRYPGEKLQPYIAAGPATFVANMGGDPTNYFNVGFNGEAGIRYKLTEHWGIGASYKLQTAHLVMIEYSGPNHSLNGFSGQYANQFALGSISYHF